MAEYKDREHFIPVRRHELVDLLCNDKGLSPQDQEPFRQFCQLVTATFHFQYHHSLEKLKLAYAPFDPDSDCKSVAKHRAEERQQKLNDLFSEFGWLMERANFRHLSQDEIQPALGNSSHWGLVMDVDFGIFERLAIFARGDGMDVRSKRRFWKPWQKEVISLPIYRRLAMILKMRTDKRIATTINTDGVYLQLFKNIPKSDIIMLLPGARVRMTRMDKGKVGLPFLSGIATALYNIADDIIKFVAGMAANPSPLFWGIATGAIGYGTKSYYSYVGTRQRYNLNLTQVLYFQNLDTNAGVMQRTIDEAEEQECREAILGYYYLWRFAGEKGWTSRDLDDYVELDLERLAKLHVDFEIGDALQKLERMRLVEKTGDRYRAVPLARALELLDEAWDNSFKYNTAAPGQLSGIRHTSAV